MIKVFCGPQWTLYCLKCPILCTHCSATDAHVYIPHFCVWIYIEVYEELYLEDTFIKEYYS